MLARFTLSVLLVASVPAAASQRVAIHATAANNVVKDASHVRTLRDAMTHAIAVRPLPAGYTVDVSLIRLDVVLVARSNELEVRVEVRAAMSDERGQMRWFSIARTIARGPQRDRALLQHDAIVDGARSLAKRLAAR